MNRIRTNRELEEILIDEDDVRFVKSRLLAWLGNFERMEVERMPCKMLRGRIEGKRRSGMPRNRWMWDIEEDLKIMQINLLKPSGNFTYDQD
jgi:hypothetical protein